MRFLRARAICFSDFLRPLQLRALLGSCLLFCTRNTIWCSARLQRGNWFLSMDAVGFSNDKKSHKQRNIIKENDDFFLHNKTIESAHGMFQQAKQFGTVSRIFHFDHPLIKFQTIKKFPCLPGLSKMNRKTMEIAFDIAAFRSFNYTVRC